MRADVNVVFRSGTTEVVASDWRIENEAFCRVLEWRRESQPKQRSLWRKAIRFLFRGS